MIIHLGIKSDRPLRNEPEVTCKEDVLRGNRILEESLPLLAATGIIPGEDVNQSRKLILDTNFDSRRDFAFTFGQGNTEDDYLAGDWDGQ